MTKCRLFLAALLPAFVCGCQSAPVTTAAITPSLAATATSEREFWSEKGLALTAADFGHPENIGQPDFADSEIVRLPDGRLRIYMFNGSASGAGSIGSMVSTDGLRWTLEPGDRCRTNTNQACGQLAVVKAPSGEWRIFANGGDGIVSATSSDGLSWKDDPGLRISNTSFPGSADESLSGPHVTPLAGGGWRMYFDKSSPSWHPEGNSSAPAPRILSAFSTDLMNWTPDPGIRATGLQHPNVIALAGGGYQMFGHAGFPVLAATSSDGLTWPATFTSTGVQGGDPVPLRLPDGSIRLYYNDSDFLARQGGGLYWADLERATWDVNFDARIGSITTRVTGTGTAVTIRVTDRGRSQDRPVNGLPHTGRPPFQVSFSLSQQPGYQPLIEVSDGSMNRYFDAYNLPLPNCGPGFSTPCPPPAGTACPSGLVPNASACIPAPCQVDSPTPCSNPACGPGSPKACLSAPPCQTGQPVGPKGCIVTHANGVQEYCPPKAFVDPSAIPASCRPYYQNGQ